MSIVKAPKAACGHFHADSMTVYPREWLKNRICSDCWRAKRRAMDDVILAQVTDAWDLPALDGVSERQRAFAAVVRGRVLATVPPPLRPALRKEVARRTVAKDWLDFFGVKPDEESAQRLFAAALSWGDTLVVAEAYVVAHATWTVGQWESAEAPPELRSTHCLRRFLEDPTWLETLVTAAAWVPVPCYEALAARQAALEQLWLLEALRGLPPADQLPESATERLSLAQAARVLTDAFVARRSAQASTGAAA